MSDVRKDVGIVTAYGYAVEGGYQGTEAQYTELMGSIANIAQEATDAKTAAETAQGKAEDAQEAAETAQGKAEDAQEAAERAQGLANDAKTSAEGSASSASESALKAEGFAVGEQNEVEVGSDSPYYHNNAKYYSEEAGDSATQAAASAATSAAMTGLAPQFVSTKAYSAGDYVLYSGTLYQFTSAHAAGAWTGTDAVQAVMSDGVSDLKSQLDSIRTDTEINILTFATFEKGTLEQATGGNSPSNLRIRSDFIDLQGARHINIKVDDGYKYALYFYKSDKSYVSTGVGGTYYGLKSQWKTVASYALVNPDIKYVRILLSDTGDTANINPADVVHLTITADYKLFRNNIRITDNFDGKLSAWDNGVPEQTLGAHKIIGLSTRIWTGALDYSPDTMITIQTDAGYQCAYYIYDATFNLISYKFWSVKYDIAPVSDGRYIAVALSKTTSGENISPSDGSKLSIKVSSIYQLQKMPDLKTTSYDLEWVIGTLNPGTGAESASTTRIRSGYIYVGKGTTLTCGSAYRHLIYTFDRFKTYESDIAWTTDAIIVDHECFIRILISKSDSSEILSSEIVDITNTESIFRGFTLYVPSNDEGIPEYYNTQVDTAIATIRSNMLDAEVNGDTFAFITDIHWQSNTKHSPIILKKLYDNANIDKIISGGDLIGGGEKAPMIALISDCVSKFKDVGLFFSALGNHDMNTISTAGSAHHFTKGGAYALMQKQADFVMHYGEPCYYYFDNPTARTRYVVLDTGLEGSNINTEQSEWITDTLDSMPNGYHAIVIAHIIYQPTTSFHVGLLPSELARTAFMNTVCSMLDTFNANNSNKKVEAIIGGHVHIDANFSTTGGIPIILTDCDTRQTFTETSHGSGVSNQALGTVNEQCFDVITVNYTARTVKCVRIGRGNNRTITY